MNNGLRSGLEMEIQMTEKTKTSRGFHRIGGILAVCGITAAMAACGDASGAREVKTETATVRLLIRAGDRVLGAELYDNAAARRLAARLPLTLTLTDYNDTEKIADLPERLPADGAPAGFEPSAGDIACYAPWGNLAIFYRDFRYSAGLIPLGRIDDGDIEALAVPGALEVTVSAVEKR